MKLVAIEMTGPAIARTGGSTSQPTREAASIAVRVGMALRIGGPMRRPEHSAPSGLRANPAASHVSADAPRRSARFGCASRPAHQPARGCRASLRSGIRVRRPGSRSREPSRAMAAPLEPRRTCLSPYARLGSEAMRPARARRSIRLARALRAFRAARREPLSREEAERQLARDGGVRESRGVGAPLAISARTRAGRRGSAVPRARCSTEARRVACFEIRDAAFPIVAQDCAEKPCRPPRFGECCTSHSGAGSKEQGGPRR